MKKSRLKLMTILGILGCSGFLGIQFEAHAVEYHEKVIPNVNASLSHKSLEEIRQLALQELSQENVKTFLLAYKQEIEREKKLEAVKVSVLSQNPSLQTFYENHEMELRQESARKRFIEEQYLSAFYDNTSSCQKPKGEPN